MKIVYILEVNPYEDSGIIKKVRDQIGYWRSKGHNVLLLLSWPFTNGNKSLCIEGIQIANKYITGIPDGFVKNYLNKLFSQKELRRNINAFGPDILYTRQNTWYPGITKHLKEHNSILELNSVDFIEAEFYPKLKRAVYLSGRSKILDSVKGLVAVSPDILKHYSEFQHLKSVVVSNGINLARVKKIERKPGMPINLVFVGSKNTQWHGLQKIFQLAVKLPECRFNIVGYDGFDSEYIPENVEFYGWVGKEELEKIYYNNHFGIGSFGNFLVGKRIDSTLKVREYLAYGLPVVLGHIDVDFGQEIDFVLKVTDENNDFIRLERIRDFLKKNMSKVVQDDVLRSIDSKTKEEERLSFFEMIARV